MADKLTPENPNQRRMKWEEEKAKVEYDSERKTLLRLIDLVMTRNKDLYDINAERRRYHKG